MGDNNEGNFIVEITETLEKNGYPDKKVSLPLEKMYEVAHNKGVNFNKVLDFMKEKGIFHTKTNEKIIFSNIDPDAAVDLPVSGMPDFGGFDPSSLKGMNMSEMMKTATDYLKTMSPDQMAKMKDQLSNMSPEQMNAMKNMVGNATSGMTDEQKEELSNKTKDFLDK
jgi:hypothetical protein